MAIDLAKQVQQQILTTDFLLPQVKKTIDANFCNESVYVSNLKQRWFPAAAFQNELSIDQGFGHGRFATLRICACDDLINEPV